MKSKKGVWITSSILLIIVAVYMFQGFRYSSRFLPNTAFNDIDVSGLDSNAANDALTNKFNKETFTLLENGVPWKEINKSEVGIQANFKTSLDEKLKSQNNWLWFLSFTKGKTNEALETTEINEQVFKESMANLNNELAALNQDRTETKDAFIQLESSGFEIIPEVNGNNFDLTAIETAVESDLKTGKKTIELNNYITKPTITKENSELNQELESMNKIAKINANYTINGQTITIPTETIASWLVYSDGKISGDRDKVRAYVASLGEQYNTSTNSSQFKSTKRGTVEVPAGSYGWTIQVDEETDALLKEILAGNDFTRTPISKGATTAGTPLIGNTYIEVDLVNQHMWYYKDGTVALETPIVSGKPATPTPPGVNYVWNKERNATLVGEDYKTPVDYWMPIDWGGVGIHDSPWQTAYGEERYKTNGSHGCINTPPDVVARLYDMVNVGVPVIVF